MIKHRCKICFSENIKKRFSLYDDRYGYNKSYDLFTCLDCQHKYLEGDFSDDLLKDLYTNYYPRAHFNIEDFKPHSEKKGIKSWWNGSFRAYSNVPESVRVLDIGCGFCESLGYHKRRNCEVYGVEADENARKVADLYGFNLHSGLFNPDVYEKEFFDYVTMDQVIEHSTAPLEMFKQISTVLKPGGRLVLTTPNGNGWGEKFFGSRWINWHTPYHINIFSKKSIRIAAEKAGFTVENVKAITSSEWLFYQWLHLISFPVKGETSVFWGPGNGWKEASSFINNLKRAVILLHKFKLNHLLTRFFDALGIGDNLFIVLKKE